MISSFLITSSCSHYNLLEMTGLKWLVECIDTGRNAIQAKVDEDISAAKARRKRLKAEKRARVEGYRKEREAQESNDCEKGEQGSSIESSPKDHNAKK